MATNLTPPGTLRELDRRMSDGIDVSLLWDEGANRLVVSVFDVRSGEAFSLDASPEKALEVFHHPYAHAFHSVLAMREPPAA
jgi:hypothetical protein